MQDKIKLTFFLCGGIAIYKVPNVIRKLIKDNFDIRVVMTQTAQKFMNKEIFSVLTKHPVVVNNFANNGSVNHIEIAKKTDFAVIIPATANIISKIANGIADDIVTTTLLAIKDDKKIIFPAMNDVMYENIVIQENLHKLKQRNFKIMEPNYGFLAEGYDGKGRLPNLEEIVSFVKEEIKNKAIYQQQSILEKRVLITAGGTREFIDSVRFIGNQSSGKMGINLAIQADKAGFNVTLIAANVDSNLLDILPKTVTLIEVITAEELLSKTKSLFLHNDMLIMAAAVADFKVENKLDHKLKKEELNDITLKLIKNPDILLELQKMKKRNQIVIGFAAETNDVVNNAKSKLKNKKMDAVILNDVSRIDIGFNSNDNEVTIFFKSGKEISLEKNSKEKIAKQIIDLIIREFFKNGTRNN